MKQAGGPQAGNVVRNVLLGLVPLALSVGAVELALGWSDSGEAGQSIFRGFDPSAEYFVPQGSGWRTQMFEVDHLEVDIPPKGDVTRVVLLGGSNTQGLPGNLLAAALDGVDPDRAWDVVNLGRSGYGTDRVRILASQALRLEPDVFVIYAGHNEFMELQFATELAEAGATGATGRLAHEFRRLRSFNALVTAFTADLVDRSVDRRPETRVVRTKQVAEIPYATTLARHERYQSNLRALCELAADEGVAVVLCTVVGNDLVPPYGYSGVKGEGEAEIMAKVDGLLRRARSKIPERLYQHMLPPRYLSQDDWGLTLRSDELAARRENPPAPGRQPPPLRQLTGLLAEAPAAKGRKSMSVEGAHWPPEMLWTTAAFEHLQTVSEILDAKLKPAERKSVRAALANCGKALELFPGHPMGLFMQGLCHAVLGDLSAAQEVLGRAFDHDRAPRRATNLSNGLVRELAADLGDRVEFVDVDQIVRECCPDGLVGYEVLMDVCHLQPGVRVLLLERIVAPAVVAALR